jgi:hypothetical protein
MLKIPSQENVRVSFEILIAMWNGFTEVERGEIRSINPPSFWRTECFVGFMNSH